MGAGPRGLETAAVFMNRSSPSPGKGARAWRQRPSELVFILAAPLLWLALYNVHFWRETASAMWQPSFNGVLFMGSLFVLALFVQALLLLFLPRVLLRSVASVLFIVAALVAYFSDTYGVFVDKDMLRNVFATDTAEVAGLVNLRLAGYLLLLGVLPSVLLWRVDLPRIGFRQRLKERSAFIGIALAVCVVSLFALSASYASFFREHKSTRYFLNPASAVYGAFNLLASQQAEAHHGAVVDIGGQLTRAAAGDGKPVVLFLVIGETARASNFKLAGYARDTTPQLSQLHDLLYFPNTTSCGTATATSLPCIFSHLGRKDFDVATAGSTTNLLDILVRAGLDVQWRDNNSGCKGVCARVPAVVYSPKDDAQLCPTGTYCYDEKMLVGLQDTLRQIQHDTVIVFHQIGSHGPAYAQRYPPRFEVFKPACHTSQLDQCTREEVRNAYDNTIRYTDYNLARQIELLRAAEDRIDGVLMYVSDHGESLGENGVYLHGMPYALAPADQKHVPLMVWTSPGYEQRVRMNRGCLQGRTAGESSHDNIFHTVLGMFEIGSAVYQEPLDMFAACRRKDAPQLVMR
jgi:lipid A ethanolaminephosphotransferase